MLRNARNNFISSGQYAYRLQKSYKHLYTFVFSKVKWYWRDAKLKESHQRYYVTWRRCYRRPRPLFAISHRSLLAASLSSVSLPLCRPSFFWLSLFPFLTSSLPICHSSLTLYSGYPEIMYVHGGLLIIEWWICYLGKCSLWKFPPLTEIKARLYSTVSVWLCMYVHVYGCLYSRLRKREDEKEQELKTVLVVKEDR